jgi:hypothetical protein
MARGDALRAYLQQRDPDQFRLIPWQATRITPQEFRDQIEQAFRQHGYWDTYGEMAMGGGPIVRIEPMEGTGGKSYRASAEFGVTISAEAESLDQALELLSVFASLVWDLAASGLEGVVWHPGRPLPWPPGPR